MKISIGSDHAGFEQKKRFVAYLQEQGHEVLERGCDSEESTDYPDHAIKVAMDVAFERADRGILICGTGIGMSIVANKIRGIRAADIIRPDFAELARQHNNLNVLCLSGRFVTFEENQEIVDTFLNTEYEGGRHQKRLDKIIPLENWQGRA